MDRKQVYQEAVEQEVAAFTAAHEYDTRPLTGHTFAVGIDVLSGVIAGGFTVLIYEIRALTEAVKASHLPAPTKDRG